MSDAAPSRHRRVEQQAALMPSFKAYEQHTDRVIPVVALTRV